MKIAKKIEDYQLEELHNGDLFINKYDMSLMYLYEINDIWKQFAFDIVNECFKDCIMLPINRDLLKYIKNHYQEIIKLYGLKTDIKNYIELVDYITLDEWLKIPGNDIACYDLHYLLIQDM